MSSTRHQRMRLLSVAILLLAALPARGQSFPSKSADDWRPLRCGNEVMTDPLGDRANAPAQRDIVGSVASPASARWSTADYLFLRIRLDEDPVPAAVASPYAWGILFDTDSVLSTYEVLIHVNGIGKTVSLYKNTTTTAANDPTDPPDEPAVKSYPFESHARSVTTDGSNFGGNVDFFLDVAVPWEDLEAVGINRRTPVVTWVATSSNSTTLNGDFACHDNAGGGGAAALNGTGSVRSALDPATDSDGDGHTDGAELSAGTDPNDSMSRPTSPPDAQALAGGGGCQSAAKVIAPLGLAALSLFSRRRRRLRT